MILLFILLILIIIIIITYNKFGSGTNINKLSKIIENYKSDSIGGILIAKKDKILYNCFKKSKLYRIYSLTKPITALCVIREVDVNKTLGEIDAELFKNIQDIKIIDLLNHTSDLYDFISDMVYNRQPVNLFEKALSGNIFSFPETLILKKRTDNLSKFWYNNTGYDVLGKVIECITGLTLKEYFIKNILKPLNMNNTYFHSDLSNKKVLDNLAFDYYDKNIVYENYPDFSGNCFLLSTAYDYLKFVNGYKKLLNKPQIKIYKSLYFMYSCSIFKHEGGGDFTYEWAYQTKSIKHSLPLTRSYFCNINSKYTVIIFQTKYGNKPMINPVYGEPTNLIKKINDYLSSL